MLDSASDALDDAFDKLTEPSATPDDSPRLGDDAATSEYNVQLFRQILSDRASLLRDFALELTVGPTTRRWLDIAQSDVETLAKSAESIADSQAAEQLRLFARALDQAARATVTRARLAGPERDALIDAYRALSKALPEAFGLDPHRRAREALIVRHLLLQVPFVSEDTLERLRKAAADSLSALQETSAEALMQAGLDRETADAILSRVHAYWRERTEHPLERSQERAKQKVQDVTERLQRAHRDFQRAEADEDRERKRRARSDRRSRALELNVWLAQLGEVELVGELERFPTERRIERVRSYLEHMPRLVGSERQEAS